MLLEDFENTRPLAKKLQTMRESKVRTKRKLSQGKSHDIAVTEREVISPIVFSSRSPSKSTSPTSSHSEIPCEPVEDSTGLSRDDFEAKRRRLLRMNDWVGVEREVSAPLRIQFTDPEDKDLIGQRRRISARAMNNHVRLGRYQRHLRPTVTSHGYDQLRRAADEYTGNDDVSIRIGSAVDRSVRSVSTSPPVRGGAHQSYASETSNQGIIASNVGKSLEVRAGSADGPVVLARYSTQTSISDEILDKWAPESAQRRLVAPLFNVGALNHSSSSNYRHRNNITASTAVGKSFSSLQSHVRANIHQAEESPAPVETSGTTQAREDESWSLPDVDLAPKERSGLRLIVPQTPKLFSPERKTHNESPVEVVFPSEDEPMLDDFEISTQEIEKETARLRRELQRHVYGDSGQRNNRNFVKQRRSRVHDIVEGNTALDEDGWSETKGETTSRRGSITPGLVLSKLLDTTQTDEAMQQATESMLLPGIRHITWDQQPNIHIQGSANLANEPPPSAEEPIPNTAADEEQIWRAFIFSDDEAALNVNSCTILRPQSEASPPAQTQPSMIAEVATSPLKQNPHLALAGSSDPLLGPRSNNTEACPSSELSPSHTIQVGMTAAAEASPEIKEADDQKRHDDTAFEDEFSSLIAESSGILNQFEDSMLNIDSSPMAILQRLPSSTGAQASSTSQIRDTSSDELAWPPGKTDTGFAKPKVLFTPPKPFVGDEAGRASGTVKLGGRVLRSGRTAGGLEEVRGRRRRRGRGKVVAREVEGDEIMDD